MEAKTHEILSVLQYERYESFQNAQKMTNLFDGIRQLVDRKCLKKYFVKSMLVT